MSIYTCVRNSSHSYFFKTYINQLIKSIKFYILTSVDMLLEDNSVDMGTHMQIKTRISSIRSLIKIDMISL